MKIQVRKCPFTGKIFEEKDLRKYVLHLMNLRERKQKERLYQRLRAEFKDWLKEERSQIKYTQDIIPWFLKNQRKIMDATNAIVLSSEYDKKYGKQFNSRDRFDDLRFDRIRYEEFLSNDRVCPENGVLNWNNDPTKPTSYVGWKGYISGSLIRDPKHEYSYPYSEALNIVGIHTGTGGGGNKNWGYDCSIFLEDWTGLQHEIDEMKKDLIIKKLKGEA